VAAAMGTRKGRRRVTNYDDNSSGSAVSLRLPSMMAHIRPATPALMCTTVPPTSNRQVCSSTCSSPNATSPFKVLTALVLEKKRRIPRNNWRKHDCK